MPTKPKPRVATDRDFLQDLAENNPWGIRVTADDVAAWFDMIWPRYALRGYSRHKKAITSWWSRCTRRELEQAKERAANLAVTEAEDAAAEKPSDSETEVVDYFSRLRGNG